MPYGLIPLIVSVVLAIHHVGLSEAPRASKIAVALVVGASLVVWFRFPQWMLFATLAQVVAGIYMLICLKLSRA